MSVVIEIDLTATPEKYVKSLIQGHQKTKIKSSKTLPSFEVKFHDVPDKWPLYPVYTNKNPSSMRCHIFYIASDLAQTANNKMLHLKIVKTMKRLTGPSRFYGLSPGTFLSKWYDSNPLISFITALVIHRISYTGTYLQASLHLELWHTQDNWSLFFENYLC